MEQKPAKKVTEGYLERAALHYLGRFSSTEANLKAVLARKVRRRNEDSAPPSPEQMQWIVAVAAKCVRLGYVDDNFYARQRFRGLQLKGKPLRMIAQDLHYKGVPAHIVKAVLDEAQKEEGVNPDMAAAACYARRRRFGPFRRPDTPPEKIEKEKAAMMRAGFPYALIKQVMDSSVDDLLALIP
ncbi:regulatory protein RecX [Kordiimonas pumila]|uniref:Regulatory protein RecX n=1 Tax=Kordiimonas pumila TaxID=2161677 RepID=A0ABV7D2W6_9PROT|nr:RecX family transcriptional regulator [Kordiimonas pumila]